MKRFLIPAVVLAAAAAVPAAGPKPVELLVATDNHGPELWKALNERFEADQARKGEPATVRPSVAAWGRQRDAVAKKELEPDVVALGVGTDIDPLRQAGLIPADWPYRLPHRAAPFGSLTAFVVPKGNPRGVKDWPDLARPDVRALSLNPRGSRTARHAVLAAYGAVRQRGGSEADARAFVAAVFGRAKLPTPRAAGDAATAGEAPAFLPADPGDVLLTWEKEAIDAVRKAGGALEVVYPPISVRGDSPVAVTAHAARRGTARAAEAYLTFLYSDEAQELVAAHGYRPVKPAVLRKARPDAPAVELFDARDLFPDVAKGHDEFFARDGFFDQVRARAK